MSTILDALAGNAAPNYQTTIPQENITPQSPAVEALSAYAEQGAAEKARTEAPEAKDTPEVWVNPFTGKMEGKNIDVALLQGLMEKSRKYDEILAGYSNEIQRLQGQAQYIQKNPVMNVLSTVAGNVAQTEGFSPIVRALGKSAVQLNPTVDQLRHQAQQLGLATEPVRRGQAELYRSAAEIAAKMQGELDRESNIAMASRKEREANVKTTASQIAESIKAGTGEFDVGNAVSALQDSGATAEEIRTTIGMLSDLSRNVGATWAAKKAEADRKSAEDTRRENRADALLAERARETDMREARITYANQNSAYRVNTRVGVSEQAAIRGSFNVLDLSKKLDEAAKKVKMNPITGKIQYMNPFRPEEMQAIKVYSTQLLVSGAAGGKLGAGVSNLDLNKLESIIAGGVMTPDQFAVTQKILMHATTSNMDRQMKLSPNVQFWKTAKPLFESFGLSEMYERNMDTMEESLAESYPALFGPNRSPLAEKEYGPSRASRGTSGQTDILDRKQDKDGNVWVWRKGSPKWERE